MVAASLLSSRESDAGRVWTEAGEHPRISECPSGQPPTLAPPQPASQPSRPAEPDQSPSPGTGLRQHPLQALPEVQNIHPFCPWFRGFITGWEKLMGGCYYPWSPQGGVSESWKFSEDCRHLRPSWILGCEMLEEPWRCLFSATHPDGFNWKMAPPSASVVIGRNLVLIWGSEDLYKTFSRFYLRSQPDDISTN